MRGIRRKKEVINREREQRREKLPAGIHRRTAERREPTRRLHQPFILRCEERGGVRGEAAEVWQRAGN